MLIIVAIRVFSFFPATVEKYYSTGIYQCITRTGRILTGWLPISLGDILYTVVVIWLIWKLILMIKALVKKKINKTWLACAFKKAAIILAWVYIFFNVGWGLNYDRQGIAYQLKLGVKAYDLADLKNINNLLEEKTNTWRPVFDTNEIYRIDKKETFKKANASFMNASTRYPFLAYSHGSVKPSLYSIPGNYMGFTGYYNPFTTEAQVNTTVPAFTVPFTTCHEMSHQLGYAKEDEANFAGYLAATASSDSIFRYSAYFDLYLYANRELFIYDSVYSKLSRNRLSQPVQSDIISLKKFWIKYRSPFDKLTAWIYEKYLKANRQPKGMQTYNEVIADLIAFYKKYGYI